MSLTLLGSTCSNSSGSRDNLTLNMVVTRRSDYQGTVVSQFHMYGSALVQVVMLEPDFGQCNEIRVIVPDELLVF